MSRWAVTSTPDTGRPSPRLRYREQLREEIKQVARRQLVEGGGAGRLSLNGIARELGMRGPSLYRYYASRDALITELLLDGYHDIGDVLRRSVAAAPADPAARRLRAGGLAYRAWAITHPELFDLLYGRPVPGYRAPAETGPPARANLILLADLIHEARHTGERPAGGEPWRTTAVPAGDETFEIAVRFTARLHGLLVLELHGHLPHMVPDPEAVYGRELDAAVDWAVTARGI
jgi:AcrR family transcriptional regulator